MKRYAKEFTISTAGQRSPRWYKERAGKPSASGLAFLFDTLKDGYTPSAKAKNYLKQLAYERKFNVTYEIFVTKPMKDGIFFEDFAKMVYERDTGNKLAEAFSYVSDWFVATPDAIVQEFTKVGELEVLGKKGGLECKIVGDKTFLELMQEGIPIEHERQTQAQMMATGWDWIDYIVVNLKTRAYFILRIHRNNKLIKQIYERLHEPLNLPELKDVGVKRFDETMLENWMGGNNIKEQDLIIPDLGF
jgi:YqaJ-like viral recombinase domain